MEASKAQQILTAYKRRVSIREVYEALDVAIEALAWKALDKSEVTDVESRQKALDKK